MLASVGLGHARHVLDTHDALLKIPVVELLVAAKAEDFLMRQMSLDKILILVERNFTRFKLLHQVHNSLFLFICLNIDIVLKNINTSFEDTFVFADLTHAELTLLLPGLLARHMINLLVEHLLLPCCGDEDLTVSSLISLLLRDLIDWLAWGWCVRNSG